jgi:hypothetical protein
MAPWMSVESHRNTRRERIVNSRILYKAISCIETHWRKLGEHEPDCGQAIPKFATAYHTGVSYNLCLHCKSKCCENANGRGATTITLTPRTACWLIPLLPGAVKIRYAVGLSAQGLPCNRLLIKVVALQGSRGENMIYRILVDNLYYTTRPRQWSVVLTDRSWQTLQRLIPTEVLKCLTNMKNKRFESWDQYRRVLEKVLGQERVNTYEPVISSCAEKDFTDLERLALPQDQEYKTVEGASYGWLADIMDERGLHAPNITNPRARFYFTEIGWERVGRYVAAEARRLGHVVKVIRRKEPDQSQLVYEDELQVAILPRKNKATG